jgi:alginate O-acetyltransferase complex protein AlgI
VLFFPALTAGPIDRAEHFAAEYRALPSIQRQDASRYTIGAARIAIGLFKKFVIADSLALIALNPTNAAQATSTGALWFLLYAYAFRLFFDFSGYSDIAIGLGLLYGLRLPENFDRPYLRPNLAAFWQGWHITLGNWARFYVFSPLSRALLQRKPRPSAVLVVLIAQLATMLTIGLWHGVAWTFALWALWHGVGLFVHKLWSDRTRMLYLRVQQRPTLRRAWTVAGVVLTFHFVVLGWVWFALPDIQLAAATWARLFGQGR